jgi:predicted PurR-regulated permease PerM
VSTTASRRRYALAALLLGVLALAAVVLAEVIGTVFFAVTVAYLLVPVRDRLVERGVPDRWASAAVSTGAFGVVVAAFAPLGWVLYRRRGELIELIRSIPESVTVPLGEFTYTVNVTLVLEPLQRSIRGVAVAGATAAPVIVLKLFLFVILLYALLLRPGAAGRSLMAIVPVGYHGILIALDRRIRETLYGIYVLQAATAVGTFAVALAVFTGLGYEAAFTLAVVAGILQFVPVVGPGVLVGALAVVDFVTGDPTRAVLVAVLGSVFVGLAPDAIIRPRLASRAAHLPMSLYFIGFTGGVLTVGAIGFIAGPLVVAVLIEVVSLLASAGDGSLEPPFDGVGDGDGHGEGEGKGDEDRDRGDPPDDGSTEVGRSESSAESEYGPDADPEGGAT